MRKMIYLGLVGVLLSSSAFAADMNAPVYKAAPAPIVGNPWDGFYVGANVGYGGSNFSASALGISESQSASGAIYGGQLGYNKTFGTYLLGLETDFQGASISGGDATNGIQTNLNWFGTTRVRAGYLVTPAWLFYGSGGVAYGQAQLSAFGNAVQMTVPGIGWAAGVGTEVALGSGWSAGVEYLHTDLSGTSVNIGNIGLNTNVTNDIGRFRVDYKFW
jgi:outer membrane immunogenic protein